MNKKISALTELLSIDLQEIIYAVKGGVDYKMKLQTLYNAILVTAGSGNVVGPGVSVNNNVALFDGTTGNLLKDSGLQLSGTNTGDEPSATSTTEGIVELAIASEVNTGNDAVRAITPDALAGSNFGIRYIAFSLNGSTALTTSDKAYLRIPSGYSGMNLVSVRGEVGTGASGASSSGIPTFTVKNVTDSVQMLSTNLTIDATEYTSATVVTPVVINTATDDVVTDDLIEVACTVAGTGVTYASIILGFQLP